VRDVKDREAADKDREKKGLGPEKAAGDSASMEEENIVRQIFDTISDSASGTITRSDLSAAFNLFDETSSDPQFAERMMSDLLPPHLTHLDFACFNGFLLKFIQSQFLAKLEGVVSNQPLFVAIGGRDLEVVIEAERLTLAGLEQVGQEQGVDEGVDEVACACAGEWKRRGGETPAKIRGGGTKDVSKDARGPWLTPGGGCVCSSPGPSFCVGPPPFLCRPTRC
jgi:hypothetical protein